MFSKNFKNYLLHLFILTIVFSILSFAFAIFAPDYHVSDFIYFFAPLFFLISITGRIVLEYMHNSNSKWFSYAIIVIRMAKFILYIIIILLYAYYNRDDAVNFILSFFVFYLIYTFYDIKSTYMFVKKNN